jgi:hypothetical protein
MPDLDKILAMDAQYRKEYPRTYNAKDMLLRGHLTAEEFDCVAKGEAMEKFIENNLTSADESDIILPDTATAPVSETDKLIKRATEYIDQCISTWVPSQLDHLVIRAGVRETKGMSDPTYIHIQVGFKLFNVLQQTMQESATDVEVRRDVPQMDESMANQYWIMFNKRLVNQFTQIILQLIHEVKAGNL